MTLDTILAQLACPRCGRSSDTSTEPDQPLTHEGGTLRCSKCSSGFPIVRGVADLRCDTHAAEVETAFANQWRWRLEGRFEDDGTLYGSRHESRVVSVETRLKESLSQRGSCSILDAGCGSGEMVATLAQRHPHVNFVGMDFTDSVREAADRWKEITNVHFVQADVAAPPFRTESFQAIYSFGVLHHLADTRKGFMALAPLVRDTGELSIWLYPHPAQLGELPARERWGIRLYYWLRDFVFLGRAHRLSGRTLLTILRVLCAPALLTSPFRRKSNETTTGKNLYKSLVFVLYDDLAPAYQHRPHSDDVLSWFAEAGFINVRAGPRSQDSDHTIGAFTGTRSLSA